MFRDRGQGNRRAEPRRTGAGGYAHSGATRRSAPALRSRAFCLTRWRLILALAILSTASANAQDTPATSEGDLRFYVDYAAFRGEDGRIYEEFYLMLYADQLHYAMKDNRQYGIFEVTATVMDSANNQLSRKAWSTEASVVQDSTDLKGLAVYDQWAERLAPGNYVVTVAVRDLSGPNRGEVRFALETPAIEDSRASASQIEFVARAEAGTARSHFQKGNRTVVPNPSRRYGVLNSMLLFYYELYNLPTGADENISVTYSILDQKGRAAKSLSPMSVRTPGTTASLVHGIDVTSVTSGIYELSVQAADAQGLELLRLSRRFEVLQADYFGGQPSLTAEQAEKAAKLLRHCATREAYQLFQSLSLSGKAQFLVRFWRDHDPTPGTAQNEYLEQMQDRLRYAETNFRWGAERGDETDRGRVFMQYGVPDEVERHYGEAESAPYEIWIYQDDRSYLFVFGDLQSTGRFVLLHSTREDEVHNAQWADLIRKL